MPAPRRSSLLTRLAIVALLLAGLGYLFVRSLDDARSEPFAVRAGQLERWTLAADPQATGDRPLVLLSPPPEMPMRLFRQVFSRAGESLSTPNMPGIALVLADELRGAQVPADELLALAREAGLERARLTPRCMGYRRESQPGSTRQLYFVWFELPEFEAFRQALVDRLRANGHSGFEARALDPVMPLAAAPDFSRWMPIVVSAEQDCMAAVNTER
jgi:hypothetical protein